MTTHIQKSGNDHGRKTPLASELHGFLLASLYCCAGVSLPTSLAFASSENNSGSGKFNTRFLRNGGEGVDLSGFLKNNNVMPGTYRIDINVNRTLVGRQDMVFAQNPDNDSVDACLTLPILESLGLNLQQLRDQGKLDENRQCHDLPALVEQASVDYDPSRQQLDISVPQAWMSRRARGYVDPSLWDEGVTAGFVDYNFNGRQNAAQGQQQSYYTLGLRNGLNLGPWRLRNYSNYSSSRAGNVFRSDRTYAQRDLTSLKSQLTLGTAYTDSSTFDSVRLKGVFLASDDAMLPDSERGYAPTVRGDAQTNATVEIRQNGYLLSSTNVAPGPFVIDDVYPSGSNGDLEVTVIEADGHRQVFTQAFAALPQMIRRGTYRYNLSLGSYDGNYTGGTSPTIGTLGLSYGLTDETTVLGGTQWAPDFTALNLGVSKNTPIGALAMSVTQSASTLANESRKGHSVRLLYSKTLSPTDTTFSLASYRYSTEGYRSLSEHITDLHYDGRYGVRGRAKSRVDLTFSQGLGARKNGSVYLNLGEQRYWNLPGQSRHYTVGYSNNWGSLGYNLNATHTMSASTNNGSDKHNVDNLTRVSLTLSLPLGEGRSSVSSTLSSDSNGQTSLQGKVNGAILGRNDTFYSVSAGSETLGGKSLNASVGGTTPVAQVNLGYGQGSNYRSMSGGASGSIVAHAGGINLGLPVGDGFTLVHVPGVPWTAVGNNAGITTGLNGYAVIPGSQPYRTNWINLDSNQLGADIEIDNTIQQVIPRRGSVTVARFAVKKGRRVQFELVRPDGSAIPFGASVENDQGIQLAIADPKGYALALVEEDNGVLNVVSGTQVCKAAYSLPEKINKQGYEQAKLICK